VTVAEIVKRKHLGLTQKTEISSKKEEDIWDPLIPELDQYALYIMHFYFLVLFASYFYIGTKIYLLSLSLSLSLYVF